MAELGNNPPATGRGAAAPGASRERAADLRAGGGKVVAESFPWGGEEDGAGWEQHMGQVGHEWDRHSQETVWRNVLVRP